MSDDIQYLIPTLAELQAADPEGFVLQVSPNEGLKVSLIEARENIPMTPDYECFSLLLALPHGVQLPQAVFNLFGPGRTQPWTLLMTPLMAEPDGRSVLEAVVHFKREPAAPAV